MFKKLSICMMSMFAFVSSNAYAKVMHIKVAHATVEQNNMQKGWLKFKEIVESQSKGQMKVDIFPNAQLGGDRDLTESVQLGDIVAASPSSSPVAGFVPDLFILDVPFSFSTRESIYNALDNGLGDALNQSLMKKGMISLGYWENGFRNLTNSKHPVKTAADLKGLKIRTMENNIHISFWKELGANPTPMAFNEVYTALQQGTIDGQENPYALILDTKFNEVQQYITETHHIYIPCIMLFNYEWYQELNPEQKAIIDEAALVATKYQRELAQKDAIVAKEKIATTSTIYKPTADELKTFEVAHEFALEMVKKRVSPEVFQQFKKYTK